MKINIKTYLWLLFLSLLTIPLFAQTSINAAAINSPPQNDILQTANIGQVFYLENASANTQEVQGVQQPLFIEVLSTEENNHLPGVTSYQEVKDNNMTINLSELAVQSLEKIEELYLHIIAQQKEIEKLKAEVEAIKKN